MALNSFRFVICFAALFAVLLAFEGIKRLSKNKKLGRVQIMLLLLFSYLFVLAADWRFCLCILFATGLTYFAGIGIQQSKSQKGKRAFAALGIVALVLMLGYFKYTNFFISGIAALLGAKVDSLNILLPIGVSFYSFSAIAYLLDVYRQKYEAVRNFPDFALYIAFFPKLMSGPIVRGREFFPQIRDYRGISAKAVADGIQIFVFGLFKKIVLADRLSVFVGDVFFAPSAYNTATVILAVISYSLQIYFDFSGYSDMAIGISKMVGFDFSPNFNLPYVATSFSDFWKRWHISLSSWFQEYLYIPLGGSRKGKLRTCINLLTVMLISGLWHGAGLTFLLWGLLYGIMSCAESLVRRRGRAEKGAVKIAQAMGVYVVVSLFWIPFRAESLANAWAVLKGCLTIHSGISQPYTWTFFALFCLITATVLAVVKSRKAKLTDKHGCATVNGYYPVADLTKVVNLCLFFIFCGLTLILGYFGNTAFIYGKF